MTVPPRIARPSLRGRARPPPLRVPQLTLDVPEARPTAACKHRARERETALAPNGRRVTIEQCRCGALRAHWLRYDGQFEHLAWADREVFATAYASILPPLKLLASKG